ncbi:metallopeptidase domain-containing protein [Anaeromicropila herbilytica]|uniref:M6 family metalloprotease domain-containing protein n=1 Tax=Anaeromicropila herbilytica TaxID=2785025 RepID=A0A7R7IBS5_9FIRM|nr:hypothetical protein [Anaeromicropila herbilytica]BCN29902.1 hypothetical protein bsdtb5_11970 [Anaeromicropila herbilytica]
MKAITMQKNIIISMKKLLAILLVIVLGWSSSNSALAKDVKNTTKDNCTTDALIKAPVKKMKMATSSIGKVKMLVFVIDFADVKYKEDVLDPNTMEQVLFGDGTLQGAKVQSLKEYYNKASYGNLNVQGNVYRYTAKGKIHDYECDNGFENLMMEVMKYYDSQIDYSDYDKNADGYMDAFSISIPTGGNATFWYGCQGTWYQHPNFSVDGEKVKQYIINDAQPYSSDIQNYLSVLEHELGHCMGLPDYYLYDTTTDWEDYHGEAGYERMEDAYGDFSSFSKLMLGWLKKSEVKVADNKKTSSTYRVSSASKKGSCLILPIGKWKGDYSGEYFVLEYITPENNNEGLFQEGGIRIFHVDADMIKDYDGNYNFKYEGYSQYYNKSHKGVRVTRLVNDSKGFLKTGDVVKYGVTNFAGYDKKGKQTVNTGYEIKIGALENDTYTIHVKMDK